MIFLDYDECDGCGECVSACPASAIVLQNGKALIDHGLCEGCQICVDICCQGALTYGVVEPALEKVVLISEPAPSDLISNQDRPGSESLRGLALPAVSSVLIWTGREIIPRLANLALKYLDQRIESTDSRVINTSTQKRDRRSSMPAGGRRRRQRKYRKRYK